MLSSQIIIYAALWSTGTGCEEVAYKALPSGPGKDTNELESEVNFLLESKFC